MTTTITRCVGESPGELRLRSASLRTGSHILGKARFLPGSGYRAPARQRGDGHPAYAVVLCSGFLRDTCILVYCPQNSYTTIF